MNACDTPPYRLGTKAGRNPAEAPVRSHLVPNSSCVRTHRFSLSHLRKIRKASRQARLSLPRLLSRNRKPPVAACPPFGPNLLDAASLLSVLCLPRRRSLVLLDSGSLDRPLRPTLRLFRHFPRIRALPEHGYRHALRVPVTALRILPDGFPSTLLGPPASGLQLAPLVVFAVPHTTPPSTSRTSEHVSTAASSGNHTGSPGTEGPKPTAGHQSPRPFLAPSETRQVASWPPDHLRHRQRRQ